MDDACPDEATVMKPNEGAASLHGEGGCTRNAWANHLVPMLAEVVPSGYLRDLECRRFEELCVLSQREVLRLDELVDCIAMQHDLDEQEVERCRTMVDRIRSQVYED